MDFVKLVKQFSCLDFAKALESNRTSQNIEPLGRKSVQSIYIRLLVKRFDDMYDDETQLAEQARHSSKPITVADVRDYMREKFVERADEVSSSSF